MTSQGTEKASNRMIFLNSCLLLMLVSWANFSCSDKKNNIYVISHEDSITEENYRKNQILSPPRIDVGIYNLIIDSSNTCYFYSFQSPTINTGFIDNSDSSKETINDLKPNDIVILPKGCENNFIMNNIVKLKSNSPYKNIVIASFKDSVNSEVVFFLKKLEADSMNHISLLIRPVKAKEKMLIKYKLNGFYYDKSN
jgi:hypothetical protein